jgi:hypothetical protein
VTAILRKVSGKPGEAVGRLVPNEKPREVRVQVPLRLLTDLRNLLLHGSSDMGRTHWSTVGWAKGASACERQCPPTMDLANMVGTASSLRSSVLAHPTALIDPKPEITRNQPPETERKSKPGFIIKKR